MLIVGLELTLDDFRRVARYPRTVVVATLGQLLLLPLIAGLLIWSLRPAAYVTAGLILLAACPGGVISNFSTHLARANTALSVSMTAVSSLLAMLTLPALVAAGFALFLDYRTDIHVSLVHVLDQVLLMLLVPIVCGMSLRHWIPSQARRFSGALRMLGLLVLVSVLATIVVEQYDLLVNGIGELAPLAALYSILSVLAGWGVGRAARVGSGDRFAVVLEYASRNLAFTAMIGALVLGRVEFVLFSIVFFLAQVPMNLLLVGLYLSRSKRPDHAPAAQA